VDRVYSWLAKGTRKHNGSATEFYFDLIHKLLALHPLTEDSSYNLFLSQRQSNTDQRFAQAFEKALTAQSKDGGINSINARLYVAGILEVRGILSNA